MQGVREGRRRLFKLKGWRTPVERLAWGLLPLSLFPDQLSVDAKRLVCTTRSMMNFCYAA